MNHDLLTVESVAEAFPFDPAELRHFEKRGLLRSCVVDGVRLYDPAELSNLQAMFAGDRPNPYRVLKAEPTPLTVLGLFAGAGGTSLGLENAGFSHVAVNEFDRHAAATLRLNRPDWEVLEDDIRNQSFTRFDGVDVVEAGFPCQPFSTVGKSEGFADTRGTLFHEFARAVAETRPKIAFGENVRGLLSHDGGRTLRVICAAFRDIGYRVEHRMVRGQFLDVPQKRERLIIMAVRDDLDIPIIFPEERGYMVSLREAIGDRPESPGQAYPQRKKEIMSLVPEGGYWRDLPEELQREYLGAAYSTPGGRTTVARRLAWDEPSLTLTCAPAQKQTERCHPDETRPLNVREYARIQTFPDSWEFSGGVAAQYKQIGNAVPVNMAFHIGMAIRQMLGCSAAEADLGSVSVTADM